MKASNVFELALDLPNDFQLTNKRLSTRKIVNEVEEELISQLFVNEVTVNNYTHCRIVLDEIVDVQARALNRHIDQIIVQNSYETYFANDDGKLICLMNKDVAERAKELFQNSFNLNYNKHLFNLDDVINNSSNVKSAKFKNVTIQTINGSSINGNRVNLTDIYDLMSQNGDLATIVVTYPFGTSEVSFSISNAGSIVLFSNLNDNEYIALVEELMSL